MTTTAIAIVVAYFAMTMLMRLGLHVTETVADGHVDTTSAVPVESFLAETGTFGVVDVYELVENVANVQADAKIAEAFANTPIDTP